MSCGFDAGPVEHWNRVRSPRAGVEPLHVVAEEAVQDERPCRRTTRTTASEWIVDVRAADAPRRARRATVREHAGLEVGRDDDRGMPPPGARGSATRRRSSSRRVAGRARARSARHAARRAPSSATATSAGAVQTSRRRPGSASAAAARRDGPGAPRP